MKNLNQLSDLELHRRTVRLASLERRIGTKILHQLEEIFRRRIYAKFGYSSLFLYLVKELKYAEATAYRLVDAMKVVIQMPELEVKIEDGSLSVSTISQVESYCRAQEKQNDLVIDSKQKQEIFRAVEGKSKRETEKILYEFHPEYPLEKPCEQERRVSANATRVSMDIPEGLMAKLERIKDLTAHKEFNPGWIVFLEMMADMLLKFIDPTLRPKTTPKKAKKELSPVEEKASAKGEVPPVEEKAQLAKEGAATSGSTDHSLSPEKTLLPPVEIHPKKKRQKLRKGERADLWEKTGSQCTFVSEITGKRCEERRGPEVEHIQPVGMGGTNDPENLTILCKTHNILRATQAYGQAFMSQFIMPFGAGQSGLVLGSVNDPKIRR